MPACPSCGREPTSGDSFCRGCGSPIALEPSASEAAGQPLTIATFGPATGWAGRSITYADGDFVVDGVGPIAAKAIVEVDRQGHLTWAHDGLREWVETVASSEGPASQMPPYRVPEPAPSAHRPSATHSSSAATVRKHSGRWRLPLWLATGLAALIVIATLAQGGYVRNGAGIAFSIMGVVLLVVLVGSLIGSTREKRQPPTAAATTGHTWPFHLLLACAVLACLVFGGLLWLPPHYEVTAPADSRLILNASPDLSVNVRNRGLMAGWYSVPFELGGKMISQAILRLEPGEQKELTLAVSSDLPKGTYIVALGPTTFVVHAFHPAAFKVRSLTVDYGVVRNGAKFSVYASVKNTGDVSGTFPGALKADGTTVEEQPTDLGPGERVDLEYRLKRERTGRCRLRLGDARRDVMVVRTLRPASGTILSRGINGGIAHLTVKNRSYYDAVAILTQDGSPSRAVLAVYVRERDEATVNDIPDGAYVFWYTVGDSWTNYNDRFLEGIADVRAPRTLDYSTSSYTSYSSTAAYRNTQWTNWIVTIPTDPFFGMKGAINANGHLPRL